MEISVYFEPADKDILYADGEFSKGMLGNIIKPYTGENSFPVLDDVDIAIIGVKEDRKNVNNEGCALAPDYVRKYFYKLFSGGHELKIADLGNIKRGFDVNDTYFAVSSVVEELIKNNILPVIIGGSQDITYANYLAYEQLGQIINIVTVDSHFDLGKDEADLNSHSYLSKIILHQPNFLFNYANVGYQTYFVDQDAIELMKKLYFDIYRLGEVRADMEEVEPIVRNADMLSIDISSIRKSDAPANGNAYPNGFYGEEMCRIARYAGLSDKLSSIGFYELNPRLDKEEQTSHLVAQIIWYFIDGFYNRKHDFPLKDKSDYLQYRVNIQKNKYEIVFYKSKKSDRWWMEVPCTADKYERHHLIPCSYNDYQSACKEDMPDRWWQAYQKFS
ncbi:MAG: formimidoylglutamase [Bacteroidales bacterium]|nr:formimidoylglutamase [Bacteroidales bacterium]